MIKLKCLEAYTRDVGRGVIRIDYDTMDELGVSTGDVVEIVGKKKTVGKALPLYPSDENKNICRMDGLMRNNANTNIGKNVKIKKVKVERAESLAVFPLEAIPPIDERYLADALESMVFITGDNTMIPYFGGRLTFEVKSTVPKGVVIVTQKTVFNIVEKDEVDKVTCPTCGSLI